MATLDRGHIEAELIRAVLDYDKSKSALTGSDGAFEDHQKRTSRLTIGLRRGDLVRLILSQARHTATLLQSMEAIQPGTIEAVLAEISSREGV